MKKETLKTPDCLGQSADSSRACTEDLGELPQKDYQKKQLAAAKRFAHRRDLVNSLLEEDQPYTIAEVNRLIEEFLNRKVK